MIEKGEPQNFYSKKLILRIELQSKSWFANSLAQFQSTLLLILKFKNKSYEYKSKIGPISLRSSLPSFESSILARIQLASEGMTLELVFTWGFRGFTVD